MTSDDGLEGYRGELSRKCVTIAEVLRPAGYGTYMAGKWHVTGNIKPGGAKDNWPCQRGFDRFYGTIHGAGSFYDPNSLTRDNTQISPYADEQYKPKKFYYTDAISDHAVRFIADHFDKHADKPMFMYVAYTAAHWPMHALEKDIAKYRGKYDGGYEPIRKARFERLRKMGMINRDWPLSPQAGDWDAVADKAWEARCMEVYAAMVDCMDQGIGRIVAELKKQDQLDNTLIFFLQDNGGCAEGYGRQAGKGGAGVAPGQDERSGKGPLAPMDPAALQPDMTPKQTRAGWPTRQGAGVMPGPDGTFISYGKAWANVSNTPFREYKHWVHEGGIATPLIVHWPGRAADKGKCRHQPGQLVDIMATCVDASGATYPKEFAGNPIQPMEGRSLAPAFDDKPIQREGLFWEHEGNRAISRDNWKLVSKHNQPWELYDMQADRTELHDLAAEKPELVAELSALWNAWALRAHVLPNRESQGAQKGAAAKKAKQGKNKQ
jgi:arylsulfatase